MTNYPDFETACAKTTFFEIESEYWKMVEHENNCNLTFMDKIYTFFISKTLKRLIEKFNMDNNDERKSRFKHSMVFLLAIYSNILCTYE